MKNSTHHVRSAPRRGLRIGVLAVLAVAVLMSTAPPAGAFKPYTHLKSAEAARLDVADDGMVTIDGREYPVTAAVRDAIVDWPEFYNAGTIGPDAFPDLVFGQSKIHPESIGLWLRQIFTEAWDAQTDTGYNPTERSQILAFAYGYLTHAAGDAWAHTLVNHFAEGTFPGVVDILKKPEEAEIAIRHIIVEGYIGDATPGFDGNPERGPAPGGDVSDDSSDGVDLPDATEFAGVRRFIFHTLIDPAAATPIPDRGVVLDFFLGLRDSLDTAVAGFNPQPVDTLVGAYRDAKSRFDDIGPKITEIQGLWEDFKNCDLLDPTCSRVLIGGEIVIKAAALGITVSIDGLAALGDLLAVAFTAAFEAVTWAADQLIDAYLLAWRDDIDAGLLDWAEVGRSTAVALFNPQARRDLQNEKCQFSGSESSLTRENCEKAIGATDVLFDELDPFINDHLLSMLGLPDFVGDARSALGEVGDAIDGVLGPLGIPFNPVKEAGAEIKEQAVGLLKLMAYMAFGVSIDSIESMLSSPSSWLDVQQIAVLDLRPADSAVDAIVAVLEAFGLDVDLPNLGVTEFNLFQPGAHAELDAYLGFTAGDGHLEPVAPPFPGFPVPGSKLADDAQFAPGDLKIYDNTVTLAKMLMLDGTQLDNVIADRFGPAYPKYHFYGDSWRSNVMLTTLTSLDPPGPAKAPAGQWLASIDADHAWRRDGQPMPGSPGGGNGNFPLYESCVLRDRVFRGLFSDWEHHDPVATGGQSNFPDYGDTTSPDPNDPTPPLVGVAYGGTYHIDGAATLYLGPRSTLTTSLSDGFWQPGDLTGSGSITEALGATRSVVPVHGGTVDLGGLPDGHTVLTLSASDPCATSVAVPREFLFDGTGPTIDVTSPAPEGVVLDTDDHLSVAWASNDGTGSGVAAQSATLDGAPVANGAVLDAFLAGPGTHNVTVTATDNVGNASTATRAFVIRATAASLLTNVDQAYASGRIDNRGIHNSLATKLRAAIADHQRGDHVAEHRRLRALAAELSAQRSKHVDAATADLLLAFIADLVAGGG